MEDNSLQNQFRKQFQEKFLKFFNWILAAFVLVGGFVNLSQNLGASKGTMVPVLFSCGFLLVLNGIIYHIRPKYSFASLISLTLLCVVLMVTYYTGGIDGIGIIWITTLPVIAFFLYKKRIGFVFVGVFVVWMILFYFLSDRLGAGLFYSWIQTQQALFASIVVAIVMYFYEAFYDYQQKEVEKFSLDVERVAYQIKAEGEREKSLALETQKQKEELEAGRSAMLNLLEDISQQQKKSDELAKDLQKFKQAVDTVSDHIVITNSEGIVVYANAAVERITGYSVAEAMGKKAAILWKVPQSQEFYEKMWDRIKNKKLPFFGQLQNRRKNGELYYADVKIYPVLDKNKEIVFFVGLERDVTAEKKHFETAERLAAIVEGTEDAVIGEDLNGTVISWNKGAEHLYGYTENEVLEKSIDLIIPEGRREERIEAFKKVVGENKTLHIQTQRKRKDGSLVDVDIMYSAIKSNDKSIVGFSVIGRDITKEKQIDKAKTEFVALASHQLKNPLSAVNWYTEMLLEGDAGKLNKEQLKFVSQIHEGNRRMNELVNSLLNVSRIDMGSFSIDPAPLNLKALVKSMVDELGPLVKEKGLVLKTAFQKDLTDYLADPTLMRMVFQNLLSNAVKYTSKKGRVVLDVAQAKKSSLFGGKKLPQDSLVISVKDTGMGIPISQQPSIFQKMFRADNAKAGVTEGNGLGLYIIKTVMEQSGGDVWFESEENKGTTFYVRLPKTGMVKKSGEKKLS